MGYWIGEALIPDSDGVFMLVHTVFRNLANCNIGLSTNCYGSPRDRAVTRQ
jgi:hypothetical protein